MATAAKMPATAKGVQTQLGSYVSHKSRVTWAGRIRERMWEYLTAGDPEEQPGPANF